jgi:hypothetical protein
MSACCLPLVLPTHRPWWQRVADVFDVRWPKRVSAVVQRDDSPRDSDLWFLSGLSETMQADIGLPDAIRARSQALRERDALWQRW